MKGLLDMSIENKVKKSLAIIEQTCEKYHINKLIGCFSGGHDSLCAVKLASMSTKFYSCFHANTTIGIESTRQFVRNTCVKHEWDLLEFMPPKTYEEIALEFGFPGPAQHTIMFSRLKERQIRKLLKHLKSHRLENIGLVTGVRSA